MKIHQITLGWGSTNDQIGISVGRKYVTQYYLSCNSEWRQDVRYEITPVIKELLDEELHMSGAIADLNEFRHRFFEIVNGYDDNES